MLSDTRQALAVFALNGVLALVVGGLAHAYEGMRWRLAESLREVEEVRLVEAQLQEQAAKAELAALQARINPHFFFNTLNTISALLAEDPAKADDVVQTLADLFRYTFKATHAGDVPLERGARVRRRLPRASRRRASASACSVDWTIEPDARARPHPGAAPAAARRKRRGARYRPRSREAARSASARASLDDRLVVEVEDDGAGLRRPASSS